MTSTRESIRQLLKPLQRARPRTPFWNIPAHRLPTLHLYKNLLQNAPTDAVCTQPLSMPPLQLTPS